MAGLIFDLPPLDLNELAALAAVLGIVLPAITWGLVALVGRWFVSKKKYYFDQRKIADAMEGHLKLINDCQNKQTQSDSKRHELLHSIKDLTREVSEQKQVTMTNTAATNNLSQKLAVLEDRYEREDRQG